MEWVRAALSKQSLLPRRPHRRTPSTFIRSTMRSGSPLRPRRPRERESSKKRPRCPSMPPACASALRRRRARLRADHVVLAGNVHLGKLLPWISGTLVPVWTYVITTEPLGPRLAEAVAYRGAVSDTDLADNHYRIVDGDRLLWSGYPGHHLEFRPRVVGTPQLIAHIARAFPNSASVASRTRGTGVLGKALHRMPQIGEFGPRTVACQRIWRAWHQYDCDGGPPYSRAHRRWRRCLAPVRAVRARVGGRNDRPHACARHLLGERGRPTVWRRRRPAFARPRARARKSSRLPVPVTPRDSASAG